MNIIDLFSSILNSCFNHKSWIDSTNNVKTNSTLFRIFTLFSYLLLSNR